MASSNILFRPHPVLTLSNRTVTWYSDGSGFFGGCDFYGNGSMSYTSSAQQYNFVNQPLAGADQAYSLDNFYHEHEIRCTVVSGTRDATRSSLANATWSPAFGSFYLDIAGGSFTVEFRLSGASSPLVSCTITVS